MGWSVEIEIDTKAKRSTIEREYNMRASNFITPSAIFLARTVCAQRTRPPVTYPCYTRRQAVKLNTKKNRLADTF